MEATLPSAGFLIVRVLDAWPASGFDVRTEGGTVRIPPATTRPPAHAGSGARACPRGQQEAPGSCDDLERRVPPGAFLVYG